MNTYGDHLLYCETGPHRIRRHDAQVKLLAKDLAKAARHPDVDERPVGRHRERPGIRALGRSGGTEFSMSRFAILLARQGSGMCLKIH